MAVEARLSFLASIGPTHRRAEKVAARRVDELDALPDDELVARFTKPRIEVLTDERGRRFEGEVSVAREGEDLELAVSVTDLPRRRTLIGDGFLRRDGVTCGRTVRLYVQD